MSFFTSIFESKIIDLLLFFKDIKLKIHIFVGNAFKTRELEKELS